MTTQTVLAVFVGLAAVFDDLKRRHIANWIPAVALMGGLGWQVGRDGWQGALTGVLGAIIGFAVFLLFYLMGGMGGGDVKLMAGFGALLGPWQVGQAALWTAGVGGLFAVGAIGWKALRKTFRHKPLTASSAPDAGLAEEQEELDASIPYAPAIAVGVWLSMLASA